MTTDIKIEIESLKGSPDHAKYLRCWKYTRECGYDHNYGCENLLCNRCYDTMCADFPPIRIFCISITKEPKDLK